jgi:hypothetical protein
MECGRDPSLGAHVRAPWPCVPPFAIGGPCSHACPFAVLAPLYRARLSYMCGPLSCAPPDYKFHKVVVHSTTWAFGPLTTERWLTAGCLGGDHSFDIHSHGHVRAIGCMHVRFHVIFLFIVNACHIGGHIKLLLSLYSLQC